MFFSPCLLSLPPLPSPPSAAEAFIYFGQGERDATRLLRLSVPGQQQVRLASHQLVLGVEEAGRCKADPLPSGFPSLAEGRGAALRGCRSFGLESRTSSISLFPAFPSKAQGGSLTLRGASPRGAVWLRSNLHG